MGRTMRSELEYDMTIFHVCSQTYFSKKNQFSKFFMKNSMRSKPTTETRIVTICHYLSSNMASFCPYVPYYKKCCFYRIIKMKNFVSSDSFYKESF